jgi:hypothetical protein
MPIITVDYHIRSKKFVMFVPFGYNEHVRQIPSVKWVSAKKVWTAPLIKANIFYFANLSKDQLIWNFTDLSLKVMNEYLINLDSDNDKGSDFPDWYEFKTAPRKKQIAALNFAFGREKVAFFMDMRCVSGDTIIKTWRKGASREMTIAEFYRRFHNPHHSFDHSEPWRVRALCGDELHQHSVKNVWRTGNKEVVKITLENGYTLKCTLDHKILTVGGAWIEAGELTTEHMVVTNGRKRKPLKGLNLPTEGRKRIKSSDGYVREHIKIAMEKYGRNIEKWEIVHHADEDCLNNDPDNLEILTNREHSDRHKWYKNMDGGKSPLYGGKVQWFPEASRVISVVGAGVEIVYDIEMEDPYYNFVANGIVVHNCGKSKVVIDLLCSYHAKGDAEIAIIICPLSIRNNWVSEIETHSPFKMDIMLLDTTKKKALNIWISNNKSDIPKVLIVGVESLSNGSAIEYCKKFLSIPRTSMVVMDESSKIKTPGKIRTNNAISLARMSTFRYILTGTPIANGPVDLYSQFDFLDPEIIGTGDFYTYKNRYCVMGGYANKEIIGYQNLAELMELLRPYTFSVTQAEVFDELPVKVFVVRQVKMNKEQQRLYDQMKNEKMVETDDRSLIIKNTLEKSLRLQEITGGFVSYASDGSTKAKFDRYPIEGENPKITELLNVIDEIDGSIITWTQYKDEIKLIVKSLTDKYGKNMVSELHGGVNEEDRKEMIRKFQARETRFLVGNVATGGMGLTLTAADTMIYFNNSFNYIDRHQSSERMFHSDKKDLLIIDIVAENTIDTHVMSALNLKEDMSNYIKQKIAEDKNYVPF